MILLILPTIYGQTTLNIIEFYNDTATDDRPCRGSLFAAQTFTIGTLSEDKNYNISKIQLEIRLINNPTDDFSVCLHSTDATGDPSNDALSCNNSIVNNINITANYKRFNISIPPFEMNATTQYAFVCNTSAPDLEAWEFHGNGNGYTGGLQAQSADGGSSWSQIASRDIFFEIWAENGTVY